MNFNVSNETLKYTDNHFLSTKGKSGPAPAQKAPGPCPRVWDRRPKGPLSPSSFSSWEGAACAASPKGRQFLFRFKISSKPPWMNSLVKTFFYESSVQRFPKGERWSCYLGFLIIRAAKPYF